VPLPPDQVARRPAERADPPPLDEPHSTHQTGDLELTRAAQETIKRTLRSLKIYALAAALPFHLISPLSPLAQHAEARLHRL